MRCIIVILAIALSHASATAVAQVKLSPVHMDKLNKAKSSLHRLKRYYKYYKKDSVIWNKQHRKKFSHAVDSISRAHAREYNYTFTTPGGDVVTALNDSVDPSTMSRSDSVNRDSLIQIALKRTQELTNGHVQKNPIPTQLQTRILGEFPMLSNDLYSKTVGHPKRNPLPVTKAPVDGQEDMLLSGFTTSSIDTGRKSSIEDSIAAMTEHSPIEHAAILKKPAPGTLQKLEQLQAAEEKASRLLNKYREIPNSLNLSSAKRKNSLDGAPLKERIAFSLQVGLLSIKPLSINLSPQIGYRLKTSMIIGIAYNYALSAQEPTTNLSRTEEGKSSYSAYFNIHLPKSFYGYIEAQGARVKSELNDAPDNQIKTQAFVGVGRRMLVHPKFYLTALMAYSVSPTESPLLSVSRVQLRTGIQLSELACRRKERYYHPNR